MEKFIYKPKGVCSREMIFEIEGETIVSLTVIGGCAGNLSGISSIVKGMNYNQVVSAFENIKCGNKTTSCPDQMAIALKQYFNK